MKKEIGAVMVLALALGAMAAGTAVKKLSAYGYKGQSGDSILVVDADVARYRGAEKFIPLVIVLGHTERKSLHADRTSFTLTDPAGAKSSLPAPEEVAKGYSASLISTDYTMIRNLPDYASMVYLACQYVPRVAFFPDPAGSPRVLYDHVELPNRTYCSTLLYFPNPAGKAQGNYTLSYDDPKSGTHVEVPFPIEWHK
jgi:hypothetical protein